MPEDCDLHIRRMAPRDKASVRRLWSRRFGGKRSTQTNWIRAALDPEHSAVGFVADAPSAERVVGFTFLDVANRSFTRQYLGLLVLDLSFPLKPRNGIFHLSCVHTDSEGLGIGSAFYRRRLEVLEERNVNCAVGISWHHPEHSHDSRALFEKWDFEPLATIDRYYQRTGGRPQCPVCGDVCTCAATLFLRTEIGS